MLIRRRVHLVLAVTIALAAGALAAGTATAAPCPPGTFLIAGTVTDRATGLPLADVTSVGVVSVDNTYNDGLGTVLPESTWSSCVPPNDYTIAFFADSYNREWYNNKPTALIATVVRVNRDRPNLNAALTRPATIHGRVIDQATGEGLFTSIGIQSEDGSFNDGVGTDEFGNFSIQVPGPGRYLLSFFSDYHWAEWWNNKSRKSAANVITITLSTVERGPLTVRLLRCSDTVPDFCIPPDFNS